MSKRFAGTAYPIIKNSLGYFRSQTGTNTIKSDLIILLLTNFRERVMLPTFGTGLNELLFEQADAILEAQARNKIINAISTWEPRVAIKTLDVSVVRDKKEVPTETTSDNVDSILSIKMDFVDPENIQDIQQLVFEIPLQ